MEESAIERIICDEPTHIKIKAQSTCNICGKLDIKSGYYKANCHQGVICRSCISQSPCNCSKQQPNPELISLIKGLKIKCYHHSRGCHELCTIENLEVHESKCLAKINSFIPINPFTQVMNVQPFIPKSDPNIAFPSTNFPGFYNAVPSKEPTKYSKITGIPFQESPMSSSTIIIRNH
jgi:hypothetical protein